jgi:hypothetical protein
VSIQKTDPLEKAGNIHCQDIVLGVLLFRRPEFVMAIKKDNIKHVVMDMSNNALLTLNMHGSPFGIGRDMPGVLEF